MASSCPYSDAAIAVEAKKCSDDSSGGTLLSCFAYQPSPQPTVSLLPTASPTPVPTAWAAVTSPAAGDVISQGTTFEILWAFAVSSSSLRLELVSADGAAVVDIITSEVQADAKSFLYLVPEAIPSGKYKIRLTDRDDVSEMRYSAEFQIGAIFVVCTDLGCPNGQHQIEGDCDTCHNCPVSYYGIASPTGGWYKEDRCVKCTEGMVCEAEGVALEGLEVALDHWRSHETVAEVHVCPAEDTCEGGTETGDDLCIEGSIDALCSNCEEGW